MQPSFIYLKRMLFASFIILLASTDTFSQVIISQYHEGTGTNKWIELTNLGSTSVNTASPQLKLGLWAVTGSTGNIVFTGAPSNTVNLTVTIPAYGSVLIGNTSNGTEISYLTAASAAQTANSVINFNGNDGIALLNASDNIIDQFGTGINATDISYVRSTSVTAPSSTYQASQWSSATIASVNGAATNNPTRLGFHLNTPCATPSTQPSALIFGAITTSSIAGSFTASASADEYIILRSTSSSLSSNPVDGISYSAGNTIGNATVVSRGVSTSFSATGLNSSTTYYFFIMSIKSSGCTGGPKYLTASPLSGNRTTSSGTLNYYFGNLHSHSQYSDGTGLPGTDYGFADAATCMDFLGISEHNHTGAGMSLANWAPGRSAAASATNASFLALYGMEWGVTSTGGHVIVYGVDSLIGWEAGQYQIYVPQTSYTGTGGLFNIINRHGSNAFATLAHPDNADFNGIMTTYNSIANDAIVGSAVENGPSTSTNTTYSDYPSSMLYLSYYRNMLAKGYHLGPTIDHDNHNITHGKTAYSRTVVLSPSLNESDILSSMRLMRFYATEDCSAFVNFKIGTQPLGSIVSKPGAPVITVTTTTGSPVTSLKIYSGVPGSGSNATILTSVTTGSISYTHTALANGSTRYYYIDITTADGRRTITAPIWYTRNDALPAIAITSPEPRVSVDEFFPIIENGRIILKWVSQNEPDITRYVLEKSNDENHYEVIHERSGNGYKPFPSFYSFEDNELTDHTVYYRLSQVSASGDIVYRHVVPVHNSSLLEPSVTISPNPFESELRMQIVSSYDDETVVNLYNLSGQRIYSQKTTLLTGEQTLNISTQHLPQGIYVVQFVVNGQNINRKIVKQ